MDKINLEVWQRGPVEGVPDLLQPVAHALMQAAEDAKRYTQDFPDELLWQKPFGVAAVGFHLNHLSGVVNRLFTYADNKKLTEDQLKFLRAEENPENLPLKLADLIGVFEETVQVAVDYLRKTSTDDLTEFRGLGRAQLPTTKLGLLFHAAEHSQRHIGQLMVTVRMLIGSRKSLDGIPPNA